MKRTVCLLLLACLGSMLFAQTKSISIGNVATLSSKYLNENREVWIYLPPSLEDKSSELSQYPVAYLLDGEEHFHSFSGMIHQLSVVNSNKILPQMIVVGILNTQRTRDLTPTKPDPAKNPRADSAFLANTGGGPAFMDFIEKELIPYVDGKYPTSPYRMLFGHSLGGLTTLHTLCTRPELFNSYIAADPSAMWNAGELLDNLEALDFSSPALQNKSVYVGIANNWGTSKKNELPMEEREELIFKMHRLLADKSAPVAGFQYDGAFYKNDNHASSPFITQYDGLRFIFDFYRFKIEQGQYRNPEIDLVKELETYYEKLALGFGTEPEVSEWFVNKVGYRCLWMKLNEKAIEVFKLNIRHHPNSENAYKGLGDAYARVDQYNLAIESYEKALSLNENSQGVKEKLEWMRKKKNDASANK